MKEVRLLTVVACLLVDIAAVCRAADNRLPVDSTIERIVAGSKQNEELIQYGQADYVVQTKHFGNNRESREHLRVLFSYPAVRVDSSSKRTVYEPDTVLEFRFTELANLGKVPPASFGAILRDRTGELRPVIHPIMQATPAEPNLSESLVTIKGSDKWLLTIDAIDGNLLLISATSAADKVRLEYVCDPSKRFSVTSRRVYALKLSSSEPMEAMEATHRKLDDGAYAVDRRIISKWTAIDGKRQLDHTETVQLKSIDLEMKPGSEAFTPAGLVLPPGGRLIDKRLKQ
jgi:hypothetical protein